MILSMIPYAHQSINEADIEAVTQALRSDLITRGPLVQAFEEAVANAVGSKFAVAFSSGSAALNAAYGIYRINPADRVLTTPNTFIATTAYASERNARCMFVDIDRSSGNLDLELAEPNLDFRSLSGRLFVLPVHFAGIAVDMKKLQSMISAANVIVIEDAAHAFGSLYPDGKKVGSCAYSDLTILSFHPAKHITTGEGGMVTTNDPSLDRELRVFRNSGIVRDPEYLKGAAEPWYYEVQEFATNSHMNEMQAALGLSQLRRLDGWVEKRRQLVERYRQHLGSISTIRLFDQSFDERTAYHLMVVQINCEAHQTTRTEVMEALKAQGIGTQYHYIPLYRHPCYFKQIGSIEEYFPEMEAYYRTALSLPLFADLSVEDVDRVCQALIHTLK